MTETVSFATLSNSHGVGWINSEPLGHTIISFFTLDRGASQMIDTYAYLNHAMMAECSIVCEPSMPQLMEIKEEAIPDNPQGRKRLVTLVFEDGHVSFYFGEVSFQSRVKKVTMMMGDQT